MFGGMESRPSEPTVHQTSYFLRSGQHGTWGPLTQPCSQSWMQNTKRIMERPHMLTILQEGAKGAASNSSNARMSRLIGALGWRQKYSKAEVYPYEMNDGTVLQIKQIENGELAGIGTGASVWPAAHVLCKYIEKRYGIGGLRGKRVCDIGSGTGFAGLVCAAMGAEATVTDQEQIMFLMEGNRERICNAHPELVEPERLLCRVYNWGQDCSHLAPAFDIVLISDCILPKLYPIEPLVDAIVAIVDNNTTILLSYEHRPYQHYDPREEFRRLCRMRGLSVTTVPMSEHDEYYRADDIEIWEVHMSTVAEVNSKIGVTMHDWGAVDNVAATLQTSEKCVHVKIQQDIAGAIGNCLWPSSVVTADYILREPINSSTTRKRALELGSGCGLVAMALALAGYEVTATDKTIVLPLLQHNLSAFEAQCSAAGSVPITHSAAFDWSGERPGNLEHVAFDTVVCCDCLYATTAVEPLLNALRHATSPDTQVIICNEQRSAFDGFLTLLRKEFDVQDIALSESDLVVYRNSERREVISTPVRLLVGNKRPAAAR